MWYQLICFSHLLIVNLQIEINIIYFQICSTYNDNDSQWLHDFFMLHFKIKFLLMLALVESIFFVQKCGRNVSTC